MASRHWRQDGLDESYSGSRGNPEPGGLCFELARGWVRDRAGTDVGPDHSSIRTSSAAAEHPEARGTSASPGGASQPIHGHTIVYDGEAAKQVLKTRDPARYKRWMEENERRDLLRDRAGLPAFEDESDDLEWTGEPYSGTQPGPMLWGSQFTNQSAMQEMTLTAHFSNGNSESTDLQRSRRETGRLVVDVPVNCPASQTFSATGWHHAYTDFDTVRDGGRCWRPHRGPEAPSQVIGPVRCESVATTWTEWPGTELNRRHADFQSAALPTELPGRGPGIIQPEGMGPKPKSELLQQ